MDPLEAEIPEPAVRLVIRLGDRVPRIAPDAFVAPGAVIAGDVEVGSGSSVWFGAVVRGDVEPVRIGARTNLQDLAVVHVTSGGGPAVLGDDVTVGHRAVVHGCLVHDRCLIGIGAIVLDGAEVGPESIVGAGALVPPGMRVPPRTLVVGVPARVVRALTDAEVRSIGLSASRYLVHARKYADDLAGPGGE